MNTVILSIKPKWAEKIYSGEKTIEFRRVIPKCIQPGNEIYINVNLYESAPVSRITGECVMLVQSFSPDGKFSDDILKKGCITEQELSEYSRGRGVYALAVMAVVKWNVPVRNTKRAPQNFSYVLEQSSDKYGVYDFNSRGLLSHAKWADGSEYWYSRGNIKRIKYPDGREINK